MKILKNKDKPWIEYHVSSWWENMLGLGTNPRIVVNIRHPRFIKEVLEPAFKKSEHILNEIKLRNQTK